MRWYRLCALLAVATGCASASQNTGNPDGNNGHDGTVFFDAPNGQHDAPADSSTSGVITLSETSGEAIAYGSSIACGDNNTGSTLDNIWYRSFQLSDYPAVTGIFHVTGINFLVQDAGSALAVTVKIGSYTGTIGGASIQTSMISSLGSATTTPPDTSGMTGEMVNVPITADVPAGGKFVVQIVAPTMDNDATQRYLFIGTTAASETHPGYWSTSNSGCGPSTPETMTAAGADHLVIDVIGTN